jgi:LAS superfamily LD-carboxypeptidase LdcB
MTVLGPEQLTGRVRTHVVELAEPRCTLHPDAAAAFVALRAAAQPIGIDLVAASTYRDFHRQLTIWNDKFHGRRPLLGPNQQVLDRTHLSDAEIVRAILMWSALPGASRHHWGTEIDLIDRAALSPGQQAQLIPRDYESGGIFAKLGAWLPQHCARFGFFIPYDVDRGGVQPEPWHLSYAPVSSTALTHLTVGVLQQALSDVELAGADVVFPHLTDIHRRYVLAVAAPTAQALAYLPLSPATRPF